MSASPEQIGVRRAHPECANGETTSEGFSHGNSVRQEPIAARKAARLRGSIILFKDPLETLKTPGAEMAILHSVHEQEQVFFIAERAQSQQIVRGSGRDPALALDPFEQDRGGSR